MPPAKPSAEEIKKEVRQLLSLLPDSVSPGHLLAKLASHDAVVRMLGQSHASLQDADARSVLVAMARLFSNLEDWCKPPTRKEKPGMDEQSAHATDFSDPSALMNHDRVKVHFDGASKGNPGPASVGIVITDLEGKTLYEVGVYLGVMTNNAAEYGGLIRSLQILLDNGVPEAYVFSDSLLVVNQMNLEWRVKHPDIKPLFTQAQQLKRKMKRFQIVHVMREKNARADKLANLAIKQARDAAIIQNF